jgi:hypothetical protein
LGFRGRHAYRFFRPFSTVGIFLLELFEWFTLRRKHRHARTGRKCGTPGNCQKQATNHNSFYPIQHTPPLPPAMTSDTMAPVAPVQLSSNLWGIALHMDNILAAPGSNTNRPAPGQTERALFAGPIGYTHPVTVAG